MAFPYTIATIILFFTQVKDSFYESYEGTFRLPVFYVSNIMPVVCMFFDFILNGLIVNIRLLVLNISFAVLYLIFTLIGELAMRYPVYEKAPGKTVFPISWRGFNIKDQLI